MDAMPSQNMSKEWKISLSCGHGLCFHKAIETVIIELWGSINILYTLIYVYKRGSNSICFIVIYMMIQFT